MRATELTNFVSPEGAAAIIGCSGATLWRLVAAGRLRRYHQHTRTVFLRQDAELLGAERRRIRGEHSSRSLGTG